jgi:Ycf66 protein N-terminus
MFIQPVLGQVAFGSNWSAFLGIALVGAGIALYALRSFKPKLARDYDIVFAAIALLCGGILFFQGWRQDPILQFGQFLLTGATVFYAVENIKLRGVTTEQAKRATPMVDEERPVSRVYRADLEEEFAFDDRAAPRRIRGGRDERGDREESGRRGSGRSRDIGRDSGRDMGREPGRDSGRDSGRESGRRSSRFENVDDFDSPRRGPRGAEGPGRRDEGGSSRGGRRDEYVDFRPVDDGPDKTWE